MGKGVSLVDGDGVGDTITGVEHDTGGASRGVQREHGLDGDVHGRCVERLEHNLHEHHKTRLSTKKMADDCQQKKMADVDTFDTFYPRVITAVPTYESARKTKTIKQLHFVGAAGKPQALEPSISDIEKKRASKFKANATGSAGG